MRPTNYVSNDEKVSPVVEDMDYRDTFLDAVHVMGSFPEALVVFEGHELDNGAAVSTETEPQVEIAQVEVPPMSASKRKGKGKGKVNTKDSTSPDPISASAEKVTTPTKTSSSAAVIPADLPPPPYRLRIVRGENGTQDKVVVSRYAAVNMGPYPEDAPPKNTVKFTPVQIEAVRSGMNEVTNFCVNFYPLFWTEPSAKLF